MKRIFTMAIVGVAIIGVVGLTACEKKGNGRLDPSAKVYISPAKPKAASYVVSKSNPEHLSNLEIIKKAQSVHPKQWTMSIEDWNRDIANERFIIESSWVTKYNGDLEDGFITSRDMVFETWISGSAHPQDTIAYIPNATMIEAEKAIRAAYAAENYAECYRLAQEAFRFVPITGAEYRELEKQGKN